MSAQSKLNKCPANARILFIEPFCGGSHKQLLSTILSGNIYVV